MIKRILKYSCIIVFLSLTCQLLPGCIDDLDRQPLNQLDNDTFWKSREDAMRGLTSIYSVWPEYWSRAEFYQPTGFLYLDFIAGLGTDKNRDPERFTNGTLTPQHDWVEQWWNTSYEKIALCNNFLENVERVQMNEQEKAIMVAEAKFWRAYTHFYLAVYFGNVPLVDSVLTIDEANTIFQSDRSEVLSFAEKELKDAATILPATRPSAEFGRINKAAALALLGRLQMFNKSWTEAAVSWKSIMDLGIYSIDPRFEEIFWEIGEHSSEIILSIQYEQDIFPSQMQKLYRLEQYLGYHQFNVYNNLVEKYLCTDGLPITESPLYDPDNPYDNRDPRLKFTVFIPNITVFAGKLYRAEPFSDSPDAITKYHWTGYAPKKFLDENFYPADGNNWGGNFTLVRYAEVLLSYLESVLESGMAVDQALLDNTINQIRTRQAVGMPPVTETNPDKLRDIIRRERVTELALEGIHYFDLLRWEIADDVIPGNYYGMKLAPEYHSLLKVNDEGYYYFETRTFKKGINELWPIPQSELDINKNLVQNKGY